MKKYKLDGHHCTNEYSLIVIQSCLRIFVEYSRINDVKDTEQLSSLKFDEFQLRQIIEIEILEYIGVIF